jgi:flagellar biosynthesis regulator FlaF
MNLVVVNNTENAEIRKSEIVSSEANHDAEDRQPYLLFRTINKMVREDYSNKSEIIEQGDAYFFRPKVDTEVLEDITDIQGFYMIITQEQRAATSSISDAIHAKLLSSIDCSKSKKGLQEYAKDHISKGEVKNKVALLNLLEQLPANMIVVREKLVQ